MYPQQPMAYPAQPVAYPQQPPQYAPPMPYAPPAQPYGAPAYAPPAAPVPPPVSGTLDDFFEQRSNSGPSWKFMNKPIGTQYMGVVARTVTNADVQQSTDNNGKPQFFKDGRPKFVMVVPMVFPPTAEHPDGQAGWYVKGQARDELARAMAEAGAPAGPPEAGATIRVTLTGHRPIPGMSPAYLYRIEYYRPQGAGAPAQMPPAAPEPVAQALPQHFPIPPMAQPPAQAVQLYPMQQAMVQPAPVTTTLPGQAMPQQLPGMAMAQAIAPQQAPPQMAPQMQAPMAQPAPGAVHQMPAGLEPGQQELWAKLTGQAIPQQPAA